MGNNVNSTKRQRCDQRCEILMGEPRCDRLKSSLRCSLSNASEQLLVKRVALPVNVMIQTLPQIVCVCVCFVGLRVYLCECAQACLSIGGVT